MLNRIILSIEVIALCGPAIALIGLGILFLPALLIGATSSGNGWIIGALMIICGLWGLIALASLAWHALKKENGWSGRPMQWVGLLMGLASCIAGFATTTKHGVIDLIFLGPIIATLHLLYLSHKRRSGS